MSETGPADYDDAVIYCVIPEPLADELYGKLSSYYAEDPNVEVIVDRRKASRRRTLPPRHAVRNIREVRDRRRPRVTGEMPQLALDVNGE
jgi:hypothetical protein